MQTNSFLNNLNAKVIISPNVGPMQFLLKSISALFLSYFHVLIETGAFLTGKLKGRPIIIIMRPLASLTGCYAQYSKYSVCFEYVKWNLGRLCEKTKEYKLDEEEFRKL